MSSQKLKRGEIWTVDFDPTKGAEIKKQRSALVISSDALGKLPLKVVVPITEWNPAFWVPTAGQRLDWISLNPSH